MTIGAKLKSASILSGFSDTERDVFSRFLNERHLATGESVWPLPNPGDCLHLILAGKIELSKATEFSERRVVIGVFAPGTVVGEIDMFSGVHSNLTALAIEPSTIAAMPIDSLSGLAKDSPETYIKFIQALLKITSKRLIRSYDRMASVF